MVFYMYWICPFAAGCYKHVYSIFRGPFMTCKNLHVLFGENGIYLSEYCRFSIFREKLMNLSCGGLCLWGKSFCCKEEILLNVSWICPFAAIVSTCCSLIGAYSITWALASYNFSLTDFNQRLVNSFILICWTMFSIQYLNNSMSHNDKRRIF